MLSTNNEGIKLHLLTMTGFSRFFYCLTFVFFGCKRGNECDRRKLAQKIF